jgi:hypothetical protein
VNFIVGVDLGQANDYTALAVLEETPAKCYRVRHLERHRQRSYPEIVGRIASIVGRLPGTPILAVDSTGVGRPVVDMIEEARMRADVYPITITGGDSVIREGRSRRVPKRDLVSTVAVALQTGRLLVARELSHAPVLERELKAFRAKISISGNDTYEAWRERDHDDLVLAVALALWLKEKGEDGFLGYARMLVEERQRQ